MAVHLFHRAGVPRVALQLLPGRGEVVGAALVADPRVASVIFTGSTDVARAINRQLAERDDDPVLIAETGGQNAMIVDSSALPEQVVADVLVSAFDSAGQRCSALRLLCLQEDVADGMLSMLEAAMRELILGDPRVLATDVGPVIDADARDALTAHIERLRVAGQRVVRLPLPAACERGTFVAPTLIDLGRIEGIRWLTREVFGPVLHVVRWKRDELFALVDAINATGYALTHGMHSRIDETVSAILGRVRAGNVYVNRNMIGAVVGVQPFGGHGLSGTGPKAGGPFYRARLMRGAKVPAPEVAPEATGALHRIELPGPTGESNVLEWHPRGVVACLADEARALVAQARAALAMGNTVLLLKSHLTLHARDHLPAERVVLADKLDPAAVDLVLPDVAPAKAREVRIQVAAAPGKIVPVVVPEADGSYDWRRLVVERTVTINTAAAGGNTLLLSLPDEADGESAV
jgi:RHH-type proline utilization regulon transcriptional repressor/proline dehydrogenase/delta 1-pyrroline-5-carboxylate dehydrogenase